MRRFLYLLVFIGFLFGPQYLKAQRTNGLSGLLNTPSGELYPDKTFTAGVNYLPEGEAGEKFKYNTANYFFNLTFLPFVEVTYHLTLLRTGKDLKVTAQDRAFAAKCRLWKEQKSLPSLVVGVDDFYTHTEGNQYFASIFLASDKTFRFPNHIIKLTAGYGFDLRGRNRLNGIFGGITYTPVKFSNLSLIAEYDTKKINFAATMLLLKRVSVYAGMFGSQNPMGGIAYRVQL